MQRLKNTYISLVWSEQAKILYRHIELAGNLYRHTHLAGADH